MNDMTSARFTVERGTRILVQVPPEASDRVWAAILKEDPLSYGDYDQVGFTAPAGVQHFRALGSGRNAATIDIVTVDCVELQMFTVKTGQELEPLLGAIYHSHPYEEPVIQLLPGARTRHIRGQDEDNPNRFWNRENVDWIPAEHQNTDR